MQSRGPQGRERHRGGGEKIGEGLMGEALSDITNKKNEYRLSRQATAATP